MEEKTGFVGIPDIDLNILVKLQTRDLINACQASKYLNNICLKYDTYIWKERVADEIGEKWVISRPENKSWQEWYYYLKSHPDDVKLTNLLNLNTQQSIIYFITKEKGLIQGSEAFLTIDVTLERAFKSGNHDLVSYFMDKFKKLFANYLSHKEGDSLLLSYDRIINLALINGFQLEAEVLLNYFFREEGEGHKYYLTILNITRYLGQQKNFNLFKHILEKDFTSTVEIWFVEDYFLFGLVEGYHNKEAKEVFQVINRRWETLDNFNYILSTLIRITKKAGNLIFEEYLISKGFYETQLITTIKKEEEEEKEEKEDPLDEEVFSLVRKQVSSFQLLKIASRIYKNKALYLYVAINYAKKYSYDWNYRYPITYFDEKDAYNYEMTMIKLDLIDSDANRFLQDNFYRLLTYEYN